MSAGGNSFVQNADHASDESTDAKDHECVVCYRKHGEISDETREEVKLFDPYTCRVTYDEFGKEELGHTICTDCFWKNWKGGMSQVYNCPGCRLQLTDHYLDLLHSLPKQRRDCDKPLEFYSQENKRY